MKKIAAFVTAFMITLVLAVTIHETMSRDVTSKNANIGYWVSSYKDSSYNAISQNIKPDTMLVFGLSLIHI